MATSKKEYEKMTKEKSPPSPILSNCIKAFLSGGLICTFGEFLNYIYSIWGFSEDYIKAMTPCTIIIITAILTGFGVFDKIAKHAGAGTLVPITGFANAVVSPAMEFKPEGFILGVGAKLFTIAGPVLAYGTFAGVLYGLIYYILKLI